MLAARVPGVAFLRRVAKKVLPPVAGRGADTLPQRERDLLAVEQFVRLRSRVPILYLALAIIIVAAAFASQGNFPAVYQYLIPGGLIAVSITRLLMWMRRPAEMIEPAQARKYLHRTVFSAAFLMALAGIWAVVAFIETDVTRRAISPIFQVLSAFAAASCLASVPRASIFALIFGLAPISFVMLRTGDMGFMAMAVSVAVAAVLQGRLVIGQADELVRNLTLHCDLERLANTDPLTGLLNRRAFSAALERECAAGDEFAVVMLDLNGFKPINDRYGHAAGDITLQLVAERLRANCRPEDAIARIGGDEFALILPFPGNARELANRVANMRDALAVSYVLEAGIVAISASIGTAQPGPQTQTAADLLEAADRALYAAKSGKAVRAVSRKAA